MSRHLNDPRLTGRIILNGVELTATAEQLNGVGGGGGGSSVHEAVTATGPASTDGIAYFVDTTEGAITLNVDSSLTFFTVYDSHFNFALNNCTVDFGGGFSQTLSLDGEINLFFRDAGDTWRFISVGIGSGGAVPSAT